MVGQAASPVVASDCSHFAAIQRSERGARSRLSALAWPENPAPKLPRARSQRDLRRRRSHGRQSASRLFAIHSAIGSIEACSAPTTTAAATFGLEPRPTDMRRRNAGSRLPSASMSARQGDRPRRTRGDPGADPARGLVGRQDDDMVADAEAPVRAPPTPNDVVGIPCARHMSRELSCARIGCPFHTPTDSALRQVFGAG